MLSQSADRLASSQFLDASRVNRAPDLLVGLLLVVAAAMSP